MAFLTLQIPVDGGTVESTASMTLHVTKHIDRFVYNDQIRRTNAPIQYIETPKVDAWQNCFVYDKTYAVPLNAPKQFLDAPVYTLGSVVRSPYKDLLITNQWMVGRDGATHPLWWKHRLPANTVEVSITVHESGNGFGDALYRIDTDNGLVFFEHTNLFNPDTGAFRAFYVTSTNADGVSETTLAEMVPVCGEATWQDIDPDTGELYEGLIVYTVERVGGVSSYYLSEAGEWWSKPRSRSGIQPLLPRNKAPNENWFPAFTTGEITANVNGLLKTYSIPEWETLPFFPEKPILRASSKRGIFVRDGLLYLSQQNVVVEPDSNLHLEILVYDVTDELIAAYTTDTSKAGQRYQDTSVYYEADQIVGWDGESGLVLLAKKLLPRYEYWVDFNYRSVASEALVDLNPIFNRKSLQHTYVFYLVPDQTERSLHWLVVDRNSTIIECSQSEYALTDAYGVWNPDTLVGSKYWSETEDSFQSQYCVGWDNTYQYYVLAEYSVLDSTIVERIFSTDVRRDGGLDPVSIDAAVRRNPRLLQSRWGYGEHGQTVPRDNVLIVRVPITLRTDYGGNLTEDQIRSGLQQQSTVGVMLVIDWIYPRSHVSGISDTAGIVSITASWEGPNSTYALLKRATPNDEWVQIAVSVNPPEGAITFTDTALSGEVWWYAVAITKDGITYPESNQLGIKVM